MTTQQPFVYSAQLRKILLQFSRIFSGFRVQTGINEQGYQEMLTVPVVYGGGDRQVHHMLRGASENTTSTVPRISVMFQSIDPGSFKGRSSYAGNTEQLLVTERAYDDDTQQYTNKPGARYEVERMFPVPIDVTFKVDIWTSNQEQKFQLFEQIIILFNPSLDFQTSNNPLDWTALNIVTLDSISWDDSGANRGTEDVPNVLSMTFTAGCWINPPARVRRQTLIQNIMTRLSSDITDMNQMDALQPSVITTLKNHCIKVNNSRVTLLGAHGGMLDSQNQPYSWPQVIDQYGELRDNVSKIALRWVDDIKDSSKDIIGFVKYHPSLDNVLDLTLIADTLPIANHLPVIDFIDPQAKSPGMGLPMPVNGTRYIITDTITSNGVAWGGLNAGVGDIIEYSGYIWNRVFDASAANTVEQFVVSEQNNKLYRIIDHKWIDFVNSVYKGGYFKLML